MKRVLWALPLAAVAVSAAAVASAQPHGSPLLTGVPAANTRSPGYAPASLLSPELSQTVVAQGAMKLENRTAQVAYYGYDSDQVNAAGEPLMVPLPGAPTVEAHKTEPDKNTYLVFKKGLTGADADYDYGTHFLFQGHESGTPGYVTRVNLDADAAHRITLLATVPTGDIDGSTWDPWAKRILLTTENPAAPTYAVTPDFPGTVTDLSGSVGRGGFEGIQNDSDGNLWIAEDIGGANKKDASGATTTARIPNSYLFRYVPRSPGDLANGKLQVLQVKNAAGQPITQASQTALNSPDQLALHTYGASFATRWLTVHDTATDGTAAFNANTLALAKGGTPFKRPENGLFGPGSKFRDFYFDETGDTNATSPENDTAGGWGSVFQLHQSDPSSDSGTLSIFFKADEATAAFDNVAFLSKNLVTFVQDAGDTLHGQANALDSAWVLDVTRDYSHSGAQPLRWLAEGRDASATIDSATPTGNDGDNEITGAIVSDGDASTGGILGAKVPDLNNDKWRWFYTQQHGDNLTYEVTLNR
ncbi:MAG TPA: phosphatase [Actinomycetes bacterium]|nr:phosphatase [Actinomycetes bacterium]